MSDCTGNCNQGRTCTCAGGKATIGFTKLDEAIHVLVGMILLLGLVLVIFSVGIWFANNLILAYNLVTK